MIELDQLLYGEATPEQVAEFFRNGDFHGEHYVIEAIEKHLQTEEQRQAIFNAKLSIRKMLNGRYWTGEEALVNRIYDEWNTRLGFRHFGH
jgi:hypothetical protein